MKGKIGFDYTEVPEFVEYIWKTHVPSLSFEKHKVSSIYEHPPKNDKSSNHNFSIILEPTIEGKKGKRIICEWYKDRYTVKNNIHFSEREACKRLSLHIGDIISGRNTNQVVDINVVNENMEFLKEFYPEFVL